MCATALVAKYTLGLLFLSYITFLAKMKMCSATHRVGIVHCHPTGIFILAIKESALSIAGKKKKALIGQVTTLFPILLPSPQKTKSNQTKKKAKRTTHVLEYVYVLFSFWLCFSVNLIVCFSPLLKQFP